jgi:hypothetical protein
MAYDFRFVKKPEQLSAQSNDSGIHFPSPDSESPTEGMLNVLNYKFI